MAKVLLALVTGLVGAAALHILVLFLTPSWSERNAWARFAERGDLFDVVALTEAANGLPPLLADDPLMRAVGCRFDLTDGPARISAPGGVGFWSLSVFDRRGLNLFSINDKTADAALDIVLASPFQALELRKDQAAEQAASIVVETPSNDGIVVLRAFQPDWTWAAAVDAFLGEASCRPL